jgi:hypothetical protein
MTFLDRAPKADPGALARIRGWVRTVWNLSEDVVRRRCPARTRRDSDSGLATGVIVTDAERCTSIPRVYAAGDAAAVIQQVASAIATGSEAAARLHQSPVLEQS